MDHLVRFWDGTNPFNALHHTESLGGMSLFNAHHLAGCWDGMNSSSVHHLDGSLGGMSLFSAQLIATLDGQDD